MDKPGLGRAIPALIVGFVASLACVYAMRTWQDMDPVWMNAESSEGAQVGLVLAAFVCMGTFMWGVGAFDPKMSEHGEHVEEHEEEAPEKDFAICAQTEAVFHAGKQLWDLAWQIINDTPKPWRFPYLNVSFFLVNWVVNVVWFLIWLPLCFGAWRILLISVAGLPGTLGVLLMTLSCLWQVMAFYAGQLFLVLTIAVIMTIVLFTFALLPHGFGLQIATEPNADFFANGFGDFTIPIQDILGLVLPPDDFANQTIEGTSQLTVLLGIHLGDVCIAGAGGRGYRPVLLSGESRRARSAKSRAQRWRADASLAHPRSRQDRRRRGECHPRHPARHWLSKIR